MQDRTCKESIVIRISKALKHVVAGLVAVSIAAPFPALAQAPTAAPTAGPAQKVQLLFVQNSAGVTIDAAKGVFTLKNVSPSTLFFTDRPVRIAGHYHTREEFLKLWNEGPDSLAKNPPNATLSIVEPGQADLQNAVVVLRNPRMNGNDLSYDFKLIEGTLPKAGNASVLFIDILGVWRRHIRRVAVIGTAAAVTTAAVATTTAALASASASAAQASAAQASAAAAKAAAPAPQPSTTQRLEQLKTLRSEGLITQAQYDKASQEIVNEVVK
jgi:hypothetical protein